jgi:hypothetical protein
MELMKAKTRTLEVTEQQAVVIGQLCENAWKGGQVRSREDGRIVDSIIDLVKEAFMPASEKKEAM